MVWVILVQWFSIHWLGFSGFDGGFTRLKYQSSSTVEWIEPIEQVEDMKLDDLVCLSLVDLLLCCSAALLCCSVGLSGVAALKCATLVVRQTKGRD